MRAMNVTEGECLQADLSHQPGSLRVKEPRSAEIVVLTDGLALPATGKQAGTPHQGLRGQLIVIGFVAAAPLAVGGWLWLLGRAAFALL
jgi:hypothetical protein